MEQLRDYIKNWIAIDGQKPRNEDLFIDEFIKLITNLEDDRDIQFDGDGSYFGKQITLHLDSGIWIGDPLIHFEIAYSQTEISVYSAKHNGFWYPEYLSISNEHPRFKEVINPFFKLLYRVFGLPLHCITDSQ